MADDTKDLFDLMLQDSSKAALKVENAPQRAPEPAEPEEAEEVDTDWPTDVEQLAQLTGAELRIWLAEVNPGDLLCVVAEGSEALRQRLIGQLTDESVIWLRQNLELWDPPTERLKTDCRANAVTVARKLVAAGKVVLPESPSGEGRRQDERGADVRDTMTDTLIQLVAAAHTQGVDALAEIVSDVEHPMLEFGVRVLLDKPKDSLLERRLDERKEALEAAFSAELELVRQAILAIGRGDDPKAFAERVTTGR